MKIISYNCKRRLERDYYYRILKFKMKKDYKKEDIKQVLIEEVNATMLKQKVAVSGIVERIIQTGGPTIFNLVDGTGNLAMKGFISPGARAHPEIEEGMFVKATVLIDEFSGELEGNIKFIKVAGSAEDFEKVMDKRLKEKAKVTVPEFMVKHIILDKLKERFEKAAFEIRLAIFQNRPIIVRHHNDADGYASGFALERAILPLIQAQHSNPKAAWEYFQRAPCMAPFYELDDSIRDTANSLRNVAKFSNKMPLIIIADNGSSPEDLMAIKQAKIHGADFIVIDHHGFDEDVISDEVLVHINPFLVEESGSSYSAGMLCAEIGAFINNDVKNMEQIPALSGLSDRIYLENPKGVEEYIEVSKKLGYTKELLIDIGLVIDYVARKLRFMECREYIEVLFGEPRDQQKKLVSLMAPHIKELDRKGLEIGRDGAVIEKINEINLQIIDIDATFPGFGFFPNPGRAVGLLHDEFKSKEGNERTISAGVMKTAITFRATDEANFSVHELLVFLKSELPNAFVEGGGHKNAGAISYLPKAKDEVWEKVKEFIKNRK